ncbi:FixH family protein [Alkalimarinus sediminis]|uniref:FixH family protein n=1 Tax=Alkalimarinus sediminis TaxID=1632866 RepID=A0A9E8KQG7_9ALTE|nr:FixH family protein [Alkalimarinus sediminis]UZW76433.1 FixH family protein [Alkalimarinus sediminis]
MTNIDRDTTPWFKQFWPWFLISIPVVTIIYCMIMIYHAVTTENSLVSDNYYKDGLAINQSLALDNKAKDLNLSASMLVTETGRVAVTLSGSLPSAPSFLTLKMLHPTIDGRDIEIKLLPEPGDTFSTQLETPISGKWYVDIVDHDGTWRLKGKTALPSTTATILSPGV